MRLRVPLKLTRGTTSVLITSALLSTAGLAQSTTQSTTRDEMSTTGHPAPLSQQECERLTDGNLTDCEKRAQEMAAESQREQSGSGHEVAQSGEDRMGATHPATGSSTEESRSSSSIDPNDRTRSSDRTRVSQGDDQTPTATHSSGAANAATDSEWSATSESSAAESSAELGATESGASDTLGSSSTASTDTWATDSTSDSTADAATESSSDTAATTRTRTATADQPQSERDTMRGDDSPSTDPYSSDRPSQTDRTRVSEGDATLPDARGTATDRMGTDSASERSDEAGGWSETTPGDSDSDTAGSASEEPR